jgi:hypothetical protein
MDAPPRELLQGLRGMSGKKELVYHTKHTQGLLKVRFLWQYLLDSHYFHKVTQESVDINV